MLILCNLTVECPIHLNADTFPYEKIIKKRLREVSTWVVTIFVLDMCLILTVNINIIYRKATVIG